MRIKESMDTTDIKDTTETMAIPVLEYPGTVLGCPGPLETQAYINNATQQHSGCPENLKGYPTELCLGHRLKELDNVVKKH